MNALTRLLLRTLLRGEEFKPSYLLVLIIHREIARRFSSFFAKTFHLDIFVRHVVSSFVDFVTGARKHTLVPSSCRFSRCCGFANRGGASKLRRTHFFSLFSLLSPITPYTQAKSRIKFRIWQKKVEFRISFNTPGNIKTKTLWMQKEIVVVLAWIPGMCVGVFSFIFCGFNGIFASVWVTGWTYVNWPCLWLINWWSWIDSNQPGRTQTCLIQGGSTPSIYLP